MEVHDDLPADTAPLEFDASIGDTICRMLEKICGEAVDIVLIVNREETWSKPCFITSIHPDAMEALMMGYGDVIRGGAKRSDVKHSGGLQ